MDRSPSFEHSSKLECLFLHFFDTHYLADKGAVAESDNFRREMRLATRMAVASAQTVYIPAACYYESLLCREILGELEELVGYGLIVLSGSAPNLEEYVRERQDENFYRKGSLQHSWYRAQHTSTPQPPYLRRNRSATRDITMYWRESVGNESLARKLRDAVEVPITTIEQRLERVPAELGELAFIPDHVYEILDLHDAKPLLKARIRSAINEGYFRSYVKDLTAGVMIDLCYLASDFEMPSYGRNLSYKKMLRHLQSRKRLKELENCEPSDLLRMGDELEWQAAMQTSTTYIASHLSTVVSPQIATSQAMTTFPSNSQQNPASTLQDIVLCVAAAQAEFESICRHLTKEFGPEQLVHLDEKQTIYALKFTDPKNNIPWYLAGLSFQGETEAAQAVTEMRHLLKPTIGLMVGMCMGMPKRKITTGTVVIPNEVMGFDHRRITTKGEEFRLHGGPTDNGLYQIARILSARSNKYRVIADKGLASASTKIENPEAGLVSHIETAFPDAAAFDMEGFGFYRALKGTRCLWIKAVADSGEQQESTAAGRDEKQSVQAAVTENAIDFAIKLVRFSATSQLPEHA